MALKRFIARRGTPLEIWSDNAKQFLVGAKSAQKTQAQWERIFGSEQAKDFYAKKSIRWRNTIERALWYGGVYERLILEIKKSLRRSVGHKALLTLPQMRTVIVIS